MSDPLDGMPARTFAMRVGWIVLQLVISIALIGAGHYFFYQGF